MRLNKRVNATLILGIGCCLLSTSPFAKTFKINEFTRPFTIKGQFSAPPDPPWAGDVILCESGLVGGISGKFGSCVNNLFSDIASFRLTPADPVTGAFGLDVSFSSDPDGDLLTSPDDSPTFGLGSLSSNLFFLSEPTAVYNPVRGGPGYIIAEDDGLVADYQFLSDCSSHVCVIPVPEPPTSLLFGTGLLGILGYVWRQAQRGRRQLAPKSPKGTTKKVKGVRDEWH